MSDFTVITCTGDRPEAFAICLKLIERQTLKPSEWIVIDDGKMHFCVPELPFVKYIKRERKRVEPLHTLPTQFQKAIQRVMTDKVIVMEDDDWYGENYLRDTAALLDEHELVGQVCNIYYFMNEKQFFIHNNRLHSSLCSTAFTRKVYPFFNHINLNKPYLDLDLWRVPNFKKSLYNASTPVLGIKGLPGRIGITYKANKSFLKCGMKNDKDLQFFKGIVGKDFELYEKHFNENKRGDPSKRLNTL